MNVVLRLIRETAVMTTTVLICFVIICIVKNVVVHVVCKEPQAQEFEK